ncbi:MAG: hypothetical protein K0U98_28340 [Deltaproteobacteria bacterium]|nr:hypothetical protein [Deltaproteobacteria bacterium]
MGIFNRNQHGKWKGSEIVRRYREYAQQFRVGKRRPLNAATYGEDPNHWGHLVMNRVIQGIDAHDPACAQIGIELIEEDRGFLFGAIYKANTAKALRRCESLTHGQISRIRSRVVGMLQSGEVPREYREYAKLLRAVGIGPYRKEIEDAVPRNRFATRAKAYFLNHCFPVDETRAKSPSGES